MAFRELCVYMFTQKSLQSVATIKEIMMNYSLKDNPNALIKEEFQQKPPQLHCWSFFIYIQCLAIWRTYMPFSFVTCSLRLLSKIVLISSWV